MDRVLGFEPSDVGSIPAGRTNKNDPLGYFCLQLLIIYGIILPVFFYKTWS